MCCLRLCALYMGHTRSKTPVPVNGGTVGRQQLGRWPTAKPGIRSNFSFGFSCLCFIFLEIILFIWRQSDRDRGKYHLSAGLSPKWLQWLDLGWSEARSQGPPLGSTWVAGDQGPGPSSSSFWAFGERTSGWKNSLFLSLRIYMKDT